MTPHPAAAQCHTLLQHNATLTHDTPDADQLVPSCQQGRHVAAARVDRAACQLSSWPEVAFTKWQESECCQLLPCPAQSAQRSKTNAKRSHSVHLTLKTLPICTGGSSQHYETNNMQGTTANSSVPEFRRSCTLNGSKQAMHQTEKGQGH